MKAPTLGKGAMRKDQSHDQEDQDTPAPHLLARGCSCSYHSSSLEVYTDTIQPAQHRNLPEPSCS